MRDPRVDRRTFAKLALGSLAGNRNGETVAVELGMLYSTPDVTQGLKALRDAGAQRILVLPLFPQYSGTTNAATLDQVGEALRAWRYVPELHVLPDYCTEGRYISALADSVRRWRALVPADWDKSPGLAKWIADMALWREGMQGTHTLSQWLPKLRGLLQACGLWAGLQEDAAGWIGWPEGSRVRRVAAYPAGADLVEFHISANLGEDPKPLVKVASGGEISRIMLALKTILAKSERLPILVFDEIDTGISGAVARRAGESLHRLAQYHQIIAITHLPQIASLGDTHFVVEKVVEDKRTKTRIRRLDEAGRAEQIALLLAGEDPSEAALQSARELIESGRGEGA